MNNLLTNYSVSYTTVTGQEATEYVPDYVDNVYDLCSYLENISGAKNIKIYYKGELVDSYISNRSTRNFSSI